MAAELITFFGLALVFTGLGLVLGWAVGYGVGFVKGAETERQRRTEKKETEKIRGLDTLVSSLTKLCHAFPARIEL